MKLTIARDQAPLGTDRKGRGQGVTFTLRCRLDLDPSESELVEKHRKEEYPLGQVTDRHGDPRESIITLDRLRQGLTLQTTFVSDAVQTEETVKDACADFKRLLGMLQTYGGQEEIEY